MFSQVFMEMLSFLGILIVGGLTLFVAAAIILFIYGVIKALKK